MSIQSRISGYFAASPYRSIVKDGYTTRDEGDANDTRLEIAAWVIMESDGDLVLKRPDGTLRYDVILDLALDRLPATEIAERTELKSYRDDRGGRAASTIRGYLDERDRLDRLPSSHPVKRVLRRWARSQDLGHFEGDQATEQRPDEDAEPISMEKLKAAYRLARSIASSEGFVFAPQSGDPEAVEDNERIDYDEIRPVDRPTGDTKAAALLTKPGGSIFEYRIDLDERELIRVDQDGIGLPPGGW